MKRFRVLACWALTLVVVMPCAPGGVIAQSSSFPNLDFVAPVVPSKAGVAIQQVEFAFDAGRTGPTNWGQIQVDPSRWAEGTGMASAYINVFVYPNPNVREGDWIVRNLLLPAVEPCPPTADEEKPSVPGSSVDDTQPRGPISTYINLRPTAEACGKLEAVWASVLASRQPLPEIRDMLRVAARFSPQWVPVEPVLVNAEGDLEERGEGELKDILDLVGRPPILVELLPDFPFELAFPLTIFQADQPNVNSAQNQCVPIAHANVFQYLENRYSSLPLLWHLPHSHVPGIGQVSAAGDVLMWNPVPAYSLVAQIDALTRRSGVTSSSTGSGTGRCQQIRGTFGYMALPGTFGGVIFRHQGGSASYGEDTACDDGTVILGGIVSTRDGAQPTWGWIFQQLQMGRGAAMSFGRYNSAGDRTSGHMVRVWGAARYGNREYLYTLDDSNQGPNNTGLRTQQWEVADTGGPGQPGIPDGRLNMNGLSWEIEFAISAQPLPILLIP